MSTELVRRISHEKKESLNHRESVHITKKPIICKDKIYLDIYPELNQQISNGETQEILYFQNKPASSIQKIKLDLTQKIPLKLKKNAIKECKEDGNSQNNSETSSIDDEEYIIDSEFLRILTNNISRLNEVKLVNTISKFIRNSKLMQKLEQECDNKEDINNLSSLCAKQLTYTKIYRGEILFRIGEVGDRFYFILNGKISILKPKKFNYEMSIQEYIDYCYFLFKNNENYLLNKVLEDNYTSFPLLAIEDVSKIHDVLFKQTLCDKIAKKEISNNDELKKIFNEFHKKFEDYNLNKKELEILETKKIRSYNGLNNDWDNYIIEKCNPNFNELLLFEPFETLYKEKTKKNTILQKYETFMYMGTGLFFGDFALEKDVGERTATIRAEENSVLASLKSVDYVNIIAPKRRLEKKKEVLYLNSSYFFKNISERLFDRSYFHLFTQKEYNKDIILFNTGDQTKSIIFLKTGKISLTVRCSIVDLNTLLIYLREKLINVFNIYDKLKRYITKEKIIQIKNYGNDPILKSMKKLNRKFVEELNKERIFQVALVSNVEIVGLEEIFLKIPYICKGQVISDKITCHELAVEQLNNLLIDERENIYEMFIKTSCNKILSLIERIQSLKKNWIDIAKMRSQDDNFYINKNQLLLLKKNKSDLLSTIDKNENSMCENNNRSNASLNRYINIENTKFCLLLSEIKKSNKEINESPERKNKSLKKSINQSYKDDIDFTNENNESLNISKLKVGRNHSKNDSILIGDKRVFISDLKNTVEEYCSKNNNQENKYKLGTRNINLSHYYSDYSDDSIKNDTSFTNRKKISPVKINIIDYFGNGKNELIDYINSNKICITTNNINTLIPKNKTKGSNDVIKLPKLIIKDKIENPLNNNCTESCTFRKSNINKNNKKIEQNIVKIKSFYKQLKREGCIPFITNKEKNTLFKRKYHQKYRKELPKINED